MKRFFALLIAAALSIPLFAAEDAPENPMRGGRRDRRGGRGMMRGGRGGAPGFFGGASMLQRFKAEEEISKKFPKEYAEIEKQLFEAEQKLKELAQKAKVTIPESVESKIRTLKHKQPEAFAKIASEEDRRKAAADLMKLAKENDIELFPAMNRMRGERPERPERAARPESRRPQRVDFNKLRKLYPQEMKEIEALRSSDPKAFREGLQKLVKKMETEQSESKK